MIKKQVLEALACPKCKGNVKYAKNKIICENCRLKFSMLDKDIPKMLIDEAKPY